MNTAPRRPPLRTLLLAALLTGALAAPAWAACDYDGVTLSSSTTTTMTVTSGEKACNTAIHKGGEQTVKAGGTATGTTISSNLYAVPWGGKQVVYGTATGTTIYREGEQFVENGGTATGTTIYYGGAQYVENGGTATGTTIYHVGMQTVNAGGTATGTTINYDGTQYVYAGGTATDTTINGGYQDVYGTATGTTLNNDSSGNGSYLDVYSGGTASNTTVNGSGHYLRVHSGGTLDGTLKVTGGANELWSEGTLNISAYDFSASALSTAKPVLTVDTRSTTTPALGGATISISGPVPSLKVGDTFTLIDRVSGTLAPTSISVGGYEFELSVSTGGSLIAKVIKAPPPPLSGGATAVPTLGGAGLAFTALALPAFAAPALRRRRKQGKKSDTHR